MWRTLLLALLVVGTAVAVAVGSYSALAGAGPVASVAETVVGSDGPDDGDEVNAQDGDDGNIGEGAQNVAQVIADEFGVPVEDVLGLHDEGVGFGAIFKLYLLAAAGDTTVEALVSDAEDDGGFAFGKRFKELADEVSALSAEGDGIPKNLGQLVSAAKSDGTAASLAADEDGGGPPEQAPAHGRR